MTPFLTHMTPGGVKVKIIVESREIAHLKGIFSRNINMNKYDINMILETSGELIDL